MGNRKEEILIVALHLFARDGYEAVSVSQIAGELDMTKGALYRHYKSKRDIFDCIVQRMEQQDGEQASGYGMPEEEKEYFTLPYEAICQDEKNTEYVWIIQNGRAVRKDIVTGAELPDAVEICNGIFASDQVILSPDNIHSNQLVVIQQEEPHA